MDDRLEHLQGLLLIHRQDAECMVSLGRGHHQIADAVAASAGLVVDRWDADHHGRHDWFQATGRDYQ